jgi:hypothetical protein
VESKTFEANKGGTIDEIKALGKTLHFSTE